MAREGNDDSAFGFDRNMSDDCHNGKGIDDDFLLVGMALRFDVYVFFSL